MWRPLTPFRFCNDACLALRTLKVPLAPEMRLRSITSWVLAVHSVWAVDKNVLKEWLAEYVDGVENRRAIADDASDLTPHIRGYDLIALQTPTGYLTRRYIQSVDFQINADLQKEVSDTHKVPTDQIDRFSLTARCSFKVSSKKY